MSLTQPFRSCVSGCPGSLIPPLQQLRTSGLPQCPSPGSGTVPNLPCAMLKMLHHVPAQPRASPQGTLLAVALPEGTETCPCADPLVRPSPWFGHILPATQIHPWQRLQHYKTTTHHLQCYLQQHFFQCLDTLYTHIWGKKIIFKVKIFSNRKSLSLPAAIPKDTQFIFLFCVHRAILSVQQTLELFAACKTYFVAMVTSSSKYHYQIKKANQNKTNFKTLNTSEVNDSAMILPNFTRKLFYI